jgi:molecular chaperone HscB
MTELERLYATKNYFELFSLPVQFTLDRQSVESRYLELARIAHPDLVGTHPNLQVKALELSARINTAHAVLVDELKRAEHLLNIKGQGDPFRRLRPETLDRIFELREALSLAQSSDDEETQKDLRRQAAEWYGQIMAELGRRLDAGDAGEQTQDLVNTARYVQKIVKS